MSQQHVMPAHPCCCALPCFRELLGSVSDFSLRESPTSICIVRSTSNKIGKQAKFLFSTDGSHAAALAFCVLIKCLKRPMDIVNVVMISTTDGQNEKATIDHYHDFMVENQVRCDSQLISNPIRGTTNLVERNSSLDPNFGVHFLTDYRRCLCKMHKT